MPDQYVVTLLSACQLALEVLYHGLALGSYVFHAVKLVGKPALALDVL